MDEREYFKKVGQKIKEQRLVKGLSQTALAELCGMDRQNMYHIEAGHNSLTLRVLIKIALALKINVRDLIEF